MLELFWLFYMIIGFLKFNWLELVLEYNLFSIPEYYEEEFNPPFLLFWLFRPSGDFDPFLLTYFEKNYLVSFSWDLLRAFPSSLLYAANFTSFFELFDILLVEILNCLEALLCRLLKISGDWSVFEGHMFSFSSLALRPGY